MTPQQRSTCGAHIPPLQRLFEPAGSRSRRFFSVQRCCWCTGGQQGAALTKELSSMFLMDKSEVKTQKRF